MTSVLGLEVSYYLGHEGKKFSGGKSKSKFLNLSNYVLEIFSDGYSSLVWLTLKVF